LTAVYDISLSESRIWAPRAVGSDGSDVAAVTDQGYFGIGIVDVVNASALHFKYYRTTTATLHDEVWITK
jgi:hypothetical protein